MQSNPSKAVGKIRILVFGNALVKEDSLPLRLLPLLRKKFPNLEFKELDAVENMEEEGKDPIILDSAKGISKVVLLEDKDISKIESASVYSLHDFDLGMTLKLLKKMGKINSVKLIAVPAEYDKKKALSEVGVILTSLSSGSA